MFTFEITSFVVETMLKHVEIATLEQSDSSNTKKTSIMLYVHKKLLGSEK